MHPFFVCRPLLRGVVVFFCALLFNTNAGKTATLAELLAATDSTSHEILLAKEELARSSAVHSNARAIPNPVIFGSNEELGSVRETGLGLNQELGFIWNRGAEINSAAASVSAANAYLRLTQSRVYSNVLSDLLRLHHLNEQLDLLNDISSQLELILLSNDKREQAGDISTFDAMRVRFESISIHKKRIEILRDIEALEKSLGRECGLAYKTALRSIHREMVEIPFTNAEDALRYAREHSPELQGISLRSESARQAKSAASWRRLPDFSIGIGQKSNNLDEQGWILEAELELPIFYRRNAELRLRKAEYERASKEVRSVSAQLSEEVLRAFDLWRNANSHSQLSFPPEMLRNHLKTANDLYLSGEIGYIELLDAIEASETAQLEQFEIEASRLQTDLNLRLLTGFPILENY